MFDCPACGNHLIVVPNDDPAYGGPELYYCEVAGAAHIPLGWTPPHDPRVFLAELMAQEEELDHEN